jgi:hypothetical protein
VKFEFILITICNSWIWFSTSRDSICCVEIIDGKISWKWIDFESPLLPICYFFFYFLFLVGQGLEYRVLSLQVSGVLPLELYLQSILLWLFWRWRWGVSWTICSGWPWTKILPISASQVAGIIGVDPQYPAHLVFPSSNKALPSLGVASSIWIASFPNPHSH